MVISVPSIDIDIYYVIHKISLKTIIL